jgi:glutathione peroxidase-family protein
VSQHELNEWITNPDTDFDEQCTICGHDCDDDEGVAMLEFHVDINKFIHKEATRRHELGETTSVRVRFKVFRPLMIFGQEESAFHQFMMKAKNWVGPKGERALLPKNVRLC